MNYKEKVDVLMKSIREVVQCTEQQEGEIQKALVDGFLRIVQAEVLEEKISMILHPARCPECGEKLPPDGVCDCKRTHYPVVPIQEGYGFWANGGYDRSRRRGAFQIAVSPDGEPLKEAGRMQEVNGRHVLSIVYPGCYILCAICPQPPEVYVRAYRVLSINRRTALASCELVQGQDMDEQLWNCLEPAREIARDECTKPYCRTNHYHWEAVQQDE